eukprot:s158_g9.t1
MLAHGYTGSPSPVLFWTSPSTFQEEVHEVATKDSSTRSKANVREAERSRAGSKSVAVLSWYNAQVVELKSELRRLGAKGVHVGSVVTAQGSEWDYVLLSTVLSNGSGLTEAGQRLGCLADKHLLNVAVSRGRVGLVVLGSPEVLRLDRHWAAFLEHCKGLGGVLQDPRGVPAVLQQSNGQDSEGSGVLEQYRQQKVQAAGSQQFYKQLAREPSQATSAASRCPYPAAAEARELCKKLLDDGEGSCHASEHTQTQCKTVCLPAQSKISSTKAVQVIWSRRSDEALHQDAIASADRDSKLGAPITVMGLWRECTRASIALHENFACGSYAQLCSASRFAQKQNLMIIVQPTQGTPVAMKRKRLTMQEFLTAYWPVLFAFATMALMSVVDYHECVWPPKLELTGMQAVQFMKAPVWLCTGFPTLALVPLLARACSKYGFSLKDRSSLMWWHVNLFWFHTGCDVFSGYYQVMPVLTELYTRMSPTHSYPRWHPNRVHFDCAYALELFVEAPFAAWMMYLFLTQDPAQATWRHAAELAASKMQESHGASGGPAADDRTLEPWELEDAW